MAVGYSSNKLTSFVLLFDVRESLLSVVVEAGCNAFRCQGLKVSEAVSEDNGVLHCVHCP